MPRVKQQGKNNDSSSKTGLPDVFTKLLSKPVNSMLLVQAVRVYQVNSHQGTQSTKSRGQVIGSTRKIYRQKGTGRARHGDIKAPVFVGGGVAHGPKPGLVRRRTLPTRMGRLALTHGLASKFQSQLFTVVDDFSKDLTKTKQLVEALLPISIIKERQKSILLAITPDQNFLMRPGKNITNLTIVLVNNLNAYEVLRHQYVLLTKAAVPLLQQLITPKPEITSTENKTSLPSKITTVKKPEKPAKPTQKRTTKSSRKRTVKKAKTL